MASSRLLSTPVIVLIFLLANAHARPSRDGQRLLLIYLDGFRYDYLDQDGLPLPGFQKLVDAGAKPEALIPNFPTLTAPNFYSVVTGMYTENHGLTGNYMYDVTRNESFLLGANVESANPHWWDGGDPIWTTAVRQGKKVYSWIVGCVVPIRGLLPTKCVNDPISSPSAFRAALNTAVDALKSGEADVAFIHYPVTDVVGHAYGPLSPQMNDAISVLDPIMSDLADRITEKGSNINLMMFSDHGMTEVSESKTINLTSVLDPSEYVAVMEYCALASIYTKPGKEDEVYAKLENFHPNLTVYRQSDLPDRWHYKHGEYVAPLTAVADKGWFILTPDQQQTFPENTRGYHGYDNANKEMHGIFLGVGNAFKKGKKTHKLVLAVDLYQVMCDILNIFASHNDGSAKRVAPLLTRAFRRVREDHDDDVED